MKKISIFCLTIFIFSFDSFAAKLENKYFSLDANTNGITRLMRTNDKYPTNYLIAGGTLGDVVIAYGTDPCAAWTRAGGVSLLRADNTKAVYKVSLAEQPAQLDVLSTFTLKGDGLIWTIEIKNLTEKVMEVGDVGIPLRLNAQYQRDINTTYTLRVMRHFLIAQNGSFVMAMRTNAEPPYLVMVPTENTWLEYFDSATPTAAAGGRGGRTLTPYVHSKAAVAPQIRRGGNWRQPNTSLFLNPKGLKGDSASYSFKFRWGDGYHGVRQVLYEEGKIDVEVVPGMTIPTDLPATISLHTKEKIHSVVGEFPQKTKIEYLGQNKKNYHLYTIKFSKLGENMLTINYGKNQKMIQEFFVTEPLETVIKKRANFLVNTQQHKDPNKWYYGTFGDWDQHNRILRGPEDRDGLSTWLTDSCDDAGNARPAFVASKNAYMPNQSEIAAVDIYIKHYLWGGMQQTEDEPYPYGIYGIPNWKQNRESNAKPPQGKTHLWRVYDYPHIVVLYYRMYQIAKFYPEIKTELTADEYLKRAFRTAVAYFVVPMQTDRPPWDAVRTPTMNEIVINDVLDALAIEGKNDWAEELRKHWERKVKHFVNDKINLYISEFNFDSTGFEATAALARYAMENLHRPSLSKDVTPQAARAFLDTQVSMNICDRGYPETSYYYLGSDYRNQAGMGYNLSYMSQMGGWGVLDYGLYYAKDPFWYLRLGSASSLSSWALVNSGTFETNYGFWTPGIENDGAAGGGFEPAAYARGWLGKSNARGSWYYSAEEDVSYCAGIRCAKVIAVDDPIFGLTAYGGLLKKVKGGFEVIPRNGLRNEFHYIKKDLRLHLIPERDGFVADVPIFVSNAGDKICFELESRSKVAHNTKISLSGLPKNKISLKVSGKLVDKKKLADNNCVVVVIVPANTRSLSVEIDCK